jgi:hypothetical protein
MTLMHTETASSLSSNSDSEIMHTPIRHSVMPATLARVEQDNLAKILLLLPGDIFKDVHGCCGLP